MSEQPLSALSYMDVVVLVIAAPIMLLIGVPANGYAIAAISWVILRAAGVVVERYAAAPQDANRQIAIRMGYMLGRLFALAIIVILVRKSDGQNAGLAALAVVVFAFTAQLVLSAFNRPQRTRASSTTARRPR